MPPERPLASVDIQVKVCGITDFDDARAAHRLGADWLGLNFYQESPRAVDWELARAMRADLPDQKAVYVQVRPDADELRAAVAEGFDRYQLHFPANEDFSMVETWSHIVTPARLWLAPRLLPGEAFPVSLLDLARGFLLDAFHPDLYGGSGRTSDWALYRELAHRYPEKEWILAGGLNPANVREALSETGASIIDVNSGVEIRPGRKSDRRLKELFLQLAGKG